MAMNYQNFASLGVNLNRQKYGPLDISNVFTSANDLQYYLTKGTYTTGVSEYWYKDADNKIVPYPYEGQVLATVIDGVVNVYVLTADTFEEDGTVKTFKTSEIGAKVEVDGKTIKLNADGKLELVGLPVDIAGKTLVPSLVNGELTWAEPDTSTAEGQAQEIEGLKTRATALETTVFGKSESTEGAGDAVEGLVTKVATLMAVDNATQAELDAYKEVVTEAIASAKKEATDYADGLAKNYDAAGSAATAEQNAKAYADGLASNYDAAGAAAAAEKNAKEYADSLAGNYDAKGDAAQALTDAKAYADGLASNYDAAGAAATAESNAKAYTNAELEGLELSIEKVENIEYIILRNKDGDEVASANASDFIKDSFLNDVEYDSVTGLIKFTWHMADGSDKSDEVDVKAFVQTYSSGTGLKLEGNTFSVNTEVIATVEALNAVRDIADAAQTADEVATAISNAIAGENLAQYAKVADVTTALNTKVDAETYATDKATFAVKTDVETALSGKVDNETLDGYFTKTEIEGREQAIAKTVADTYATKEALKTHEEEFNNTLLEYAKIADVNEELAKKIETGSIAHSSETLAEGVTVEGTKLNIVIDAYTKEEVRDYVADVIEDMTGGESAADVLLALNNHITTYNEKVGQLDAKDAAQDTAIAAAQTQADKGVADAKKVSDDLAALDSRVISNANEINVVKGTITTVNETLSGKITALENKDIELAGLISGLNTTVESHSTTIGEHIAAITALQNRDTELAGLINGNATAIAEKANAADVYTKTDIDGKVTTIEGLINAKANAADVYTKGEVDNLLANLDQTDINNAIAANKDSIETLVGADANKSVRTIAGEVLAGALEGADANFDTLIEMAEWLETHSADAIEMDNRIKANEGKLAGIGGENQPATVIAAIDAKIAEIPAYELPVASTSVLGGIMLAAANTDNAVVLDSNNVATVARVNVNSLVQTEGDTLIMNGGSAT